MHHAAYKLFKHVTMYRGVTIGLMLLLGLAEILAWSGRVSVSAPGIVLVTAGMVAAAYVSNRLLAALYKAPYNSESWLITALILACIIAPDASATRLLGAMVAAIIAMASKYIIVWRRGHVFNPAALGAFVVSITGIAPVTWWVATPVLTPAVILLGAFIVFRYRFKLLFVAFFVAAMAMGIYMNSLLQGQNVTDVIRTMLVSWPLLFMGSIMLTEPGTLPARSYDRLLYGLLVGVLFSSQLHAGSLFMSPLIALLLGNVLVAIISPPFSAVLRVRQVLRPAPDIIEVVFDKPLALPLKFRAGQYMEWTLAHAKTDLRGNRRTLSLASAPQENTLRIAVRTTEPISSFKQALGQLRAGDELRASNVAGGFTLPPGNGPLLFIAGGIGITPFRSMLAELVIHKQSRDIVLLYIASRKEHFIYKDVFAAAAPLGLHVQYGLGRVRGESLAQIVPDVHQRAVFISGPEVMVSDYQRALIASGVRRRHIKTDHFSGY